MVDEGIEQFNPAAAALLGSPWPGTGTTWWSPGSTSPPPSPTIEMVDDATRALAGLGATVAGGPRWRVGHRHGQGGPAVCPARSHLRPSSWPNPRSTRYPMWPWWPCRPAPAPAPRSRGDRWCPTRRPAARTGSPTPTCGPRYTLVDPLLTHSMPPSMTANAGIDALAQAIAAVVAKVRTRSATPSPSRRCGR